MEVTVKFEKKWSEETLKAWMENPDDERWDELSRYDCDELQLLSILREEYKDADIATLHIMAEEAMWITLDIHMSEIMDKIMWLGEMSYELAEIQQKYQPTA